MRKYLTIAVPTRRLSMLLILYRTLRDATQCELIIASLDLTLHIASRCGLPIIWDNGLETELLPLSKKFKMGTAKK